MILLNFSHPIAQDQLSKIESLTGEALVQIINIPVQFDNSRPFLPQVEQLIEGIPIDAETWQSQPILINLPSYNYISAMLLAAMHGRVGYFPAMIRLRPVAENLITRFEIAEIINLQAVRESQRLGRHRKDSDLV